MSFVALSRFIFEAAQDFSIRRTVPTSKPGKAINTNGRTKAARMICRRLDYYFRDPLNQQALD
jgi:hypothetical protein